MPGQTTERAFETYVEEILLTRGGWKSGNLAAVERLQEYRTALITANIDVRKELHARELQGNDERYNA